MLNRLPVNSILSTTSSNCLKDLYPISSRNSASFPAAPEHSGIFGLHHTDIMEGGHRGDRNLVELSPEDSLNLQRMTRKTTEGAVTKRTLQNRKAQREFRKRREARVRELEERCRRYDQMGIEANSELQRFARSLKNENEILKGFINRIGCGSMIDNLLEDHENNGNAKMFPSFAEAGFGGVSSGTFGEPNFYVEPPNAPSMTPGGRQRSATVSGSADFGADKYSSLSYQSTGKNKRDSIDSADQSSTTSTKTGGSTEGPLLSLDFHHNASSAAQHQPSLVPNQSTVSHGMPAELRDDKHWGSTNNVSPFFDSQVNLASGTGAGSSGSSLLFGGNNGTGFNSLPIPQRSHQNAALLNPNPIPFAFNLSSNDLNTQPQRPTWWEQMGGANDSIELDEKAQAVASSQNGNSAQSPFDLTAFLQGGLTPGGGFQLGGGESGTPTGRDPEHMRIFVELVERKVAEREARTVASLGFQPPSQDPAHRFDRKFDNHKQPTVTMTRSLTPSGVYSRLAQHPAFLSTNAKEMEELVDALGAVKSDHEEKATMTGANEKYGRRSTSPSRSPYETTRCSSNVHVDEGSVGKLLGLLDLKRRNRS